jgi:predicted kinase
MSKPILHLICGLPGSGKTTLALQLERQHKAIRFCPDEWMKRLGFKVYDQEKRALIEQLQWETAQSLLQSGNNVILEFGFWTKGEREKFRQQASSLGARTKIHFCDASLSDLKKRIIERNKILSEDGNHVNPDDIGNWVKIFEKPTADELEG